MLDMRKREVIFVRSNPLDRDVRLPKEIAALNQSGYRTKLVYWDRDYQTDKSKKLEGCEVISLRLKAPWGIKVLLFLPVWWGFVFIRLLVTRWDVVHGVNFDSIIPCIIAGRLKRKPVVYELLDIYEDGMILPKVIRTVSLNVDKLFMRLASAIVVADEAQIEGIGGIPNSKVVPIYDSPPDDFSEKDTGYLDNRTKKNFTLFYAGVLYKLKRLNLDKVVEAIKDIEEAKLIIAGYGTLVDEIKGWAHHMPDKVEFIGKIDYAEVIKRGIKAHLFFVLRDPIVPTNKHTCGSALFNAMMCGKPILVNQGTSTARKVSEENCGLVVDANNVEEIREAIIKLRDNPQLYDELGANARKAYEQRYGWQIMERRLVTLYQELTQEVNSAE